MSRRTMENRKSGKAATQAMSHEDITREFVRRYYGILNSHPDQLFQFYKNNSTVIVSEFGTGISSFTETADSRESIRQLLKKVFDGITCKIKTAIPQGTVEGGVLLLVSGLLTKAQSTSQGGNEHCFTQALVLAPQPNGFYVLNDTLHIMGGLEDEKLKSKKRDTEETPGQSGRFYPVFNGGSSMGPGTPRLGNTSHPNGTRRSSSSDATRKEDRSDSDSEASTLKEPKQHTPAPRVTQNASRPRVHKPLTVSPPCGPAQNGVPLGVMVGVQPPQLNSPPAKPTGGGSTPHVLPVPPGHGVFIARLPFGIQPDEVEKAFSAFGPILNGADGIQVRDGRNGCYAFVTFESVASAQAAIEKGAVVQGKRVYVEPRFQRPDQAEQKFPVPPTAAPPPPPPAGMSMRLTPQVMQPHLAPN